MFMVFRVCGVEDFSVGFLGLVVGVNFGFGRTKTTRNVTWSSILTTSRKNVQNGSRAYNSKRVDKNLAKCNMGFGRTTQIYQSSTTLANQPPKEFCPRESAVQQLPSPEMASGAPRTCIPCLS